MRMTAKAATTVLLAAFFALATSAEETARHFDCTGQVAIVCGGSPQRFVMLLDGESAKVSLSKSFWLESPSLGFVRSGDIVRVSGLINAPTGHIRDEKPDESAFVATRVERLGSRDFPVAKAVDAAKIGMEGMLGEFVCMSGTVSSVMRDEMNAEWNWFILQTPSGVVNVATPDYEHSFGELSALTDAEVSVNGFVLFQSRWRRFIGKYVMPAGARGIFVTKSAPPPSEAPPVPEQCYSSGLTPSPTLSGEAIHRMKAEGSVVALSRRFCLLQTDRGDVFKVVPVDGGGAPTCGTRISAVGFVSFDFCGVVLRDATFVECNGQCDGQTTCTPFATASESTEIARLYSEAKTSGARLRRRVSVEGVVANSPENIIADRAIRVENNGYYASVDVSAFPEDAFDALETGCKVRVTGICNPEFEADPSITTFSRFTGFSIIPGTPDDICVVARPPWWTARRLAVIVLSLLGVLAVVTGVAVALKALSDRRGRELYEERVAHVRTETKVEERTRLAVELHDAISQTLTGVALQVDSAERANAGENKVVGGFLMTARQMLASCRRELQDCLWDLRSRTFEEKTMTEAVLRTIGPHAEGISASVRFNVPRERLSESTTHTILCVVRELVVNAVRHGKATHVWIAGEQHGDTITFSVRDNGCGFDAKKAPGPREGHFGLQGVRERVNEAKGTMLIESAPSSGTKTTISITQGNMREPLT